MPDVFPIGEQPTAIRTAAVPQVTRWDAGSAPWLAPGAPTSLWASVCPTLGAGHRMEVRERGAAVVAPAPPRRPERLRTAPADHARPGLSPGEQAPCLRRVVRA